MALILDGINQHADTNTGLAISGSPCSIAAWIYADNVTASGIVAGLNDGSDTNFFVVQARGAVALDPVAAMEYGGAWKIADSSTSYTAATWHHVLAVFTNSTSRTIYLDGGGKITNTESQSAAVGGNFYVGTHRHPGGSYFKGKLAYVTVWKDIALTDGDAATLAGGADPTGVEAGSIVGSYNLISDFVRDAGSFDLIGRNSPTFDADTPTIGIDYNEGTLSVSADMSVAIVDEYVTYDEGILSVSASMSIAIVDESYSDSSTYPEGRPTGYDPDATWDEDAGVWVSTYVAVDRNRSLFFVVVGEQGDIYFAEDT